MIFTELDIPTEPVRLIKMYLS